MTHDSKTYPTLDFDPLDVQQQLTIALVDIVAKRVVEKELEGSDLFGLELEPLFEGVASGIGVFLTKLLRGIGEMPEEGKRELAFQFLDKMSHAVAAATLAASFAKDPDEEQGE